MVPWSAVWYVTHCNTLQHPATHCNTLQHTATHCNTLHMVPWSAVWHVLVIPSVFLSIWYEYGAYRNICVCSHVVIYVCIDVPMDRNPFTYAHAYVHVSSSMERKLGRPLVKATACVAMPTTWHSRCVAVCCSVLQCAAVCCSELQCVVVKWDRPLTKGIALVIDRSL